MCVELTLECLRIVNYFRLSGALIVGLTPSGCVTVLSLFSQCYAPLLLVSRSNLLRKQKHSKQSKSASNQFSRPTFLVKFQTDRSKACESIADMFYVNEKNNFSILTHKIDKSNTIKSINILLAWNSNNIKRD